MQRLSALSHAKNHMRSPVREKQVVDESLVIGSVKVNSPKHSTSVKKQSGFRTNMNLHRFSASTGQSPNVKQRTQILKGNTNTREGSRVGFTHERDLSLEIGKG